MDRLEDTEIRGTISNGRNRSIRFRAGHESGDIFEQDVDFDGYTLTVEVSGEDDALTMIEAIKGIGEDIGQDWYARRGELCEGQVFRLRAGYLVKLDRRVPGDGTAWYVADRWQGSWAYLDSTIEPGDLREMVTDPDAEDEMADWDGEGSCPKCQGDDCLPETGCIHDE